MSYVVDYENVSTIGLETSPVAADLTGLRANEARCFMNEYNHRFTVTPAYERVYPDTLDAHGTPSEKRVRNRAPDSL